jgi:hypothetical protein
LSRRSGSSILIPIVGIFAIIGLIIVIGSNPKTIFDIGASAPVITQATTSKLYGDGTYNSIIIKNISYIVSTFGLSKSLLNGTYYVSYTTKNGSAYFLIFNTTSQNYQNFISPAKCSDIQFKKNVQYCMGGELYNEWKQYGDLNYK